MTREEQIDWLCRLRMDLNNGIIFSPWNKEFIETLNSVLEQELKTGCWQHSDRDYPEDWHCSNCGAIVEDDEQYRHIWNYCYHCGAKMERSEDTE